MKYLNESQIANKIKSYCRTHDILCITPSNVPIGFPDLICLCNGFFIAIEVKTKQGRLSHVQKGLHREFLVSGALVYIVRSLDQFIALIDTFLRLPNLKRLIDDYKKGTRYA